MAVYDIDGNPISPVYGTGGSALENAYDINGNSLKETPDIVVMTYNPQGFTKINSQSSLLTALIGEYDPDIVGIQEAGWSNDWTSDATPFISGFTNKHRSSDLTNPNGILSKLSWANVSEIQFSYTDEETWGYSKCYITVGGKTVAWYNTHLTWAGTATAQEGRRLQTAQLLADAEQETYVIVTGDFNVWGYTFNSVDYVNVFKPWTDAGYKMANFDKSTHCIPTYTDATTASSIMDFTDGCDNIIISQNIDFVDVWFDDTKLDYLDGNPIDHIPVVATLKLR